MSDGHKPNRIIRGQPVSEQKAEFARSMRKDMSPIERKLWKRLRNGQNYDAARDRHFESKGIRVLQFANQQVVHELDAVVEKIFKHLVR